MEQMSTLRDWLHQLKEEAEKDTPQLKSSVGRIVSPGFEPLDHEGFLRLAAQGTIDRFGNAPEAFSMSQWMDTTKDRISDLPSLLSASLTFLADRRIEILPEVSAKVEGTNKFIFIPYSAIPDKRLISPLQSQLSDKSIRNLFSKIGSLSEDDDVTITQALSLHYASVLLFDRDLSAAYALVVAGLEALSSKYGEPKTDWKDWDMASTWDKFITSQELNDQQADALRKKLIKDKKMRLGDTFAKYVSRNLPSTFWTNANSTYTYTVDAASGRWSGGSWSAAGSFKQLVPEDRELVYLALRKSYEARSKYVHEGRRDITPQSQITGMSSMLDGTKPVPFALLRTMLSMLIRQEIEERATTDYETPDIRLRHS